MSGKHRRAPLDGLRQVFGGGEQELAAEFRRSDFLADWQRKDGLVVVWDGVAVGWIAALSMADPRGYMPGAVAVSVGGDLFLAVGGNDYDGAERWEQVTP